MRQQLFEEIHLFVLRSNHQPYGPWHRQFSSLLLCLGPVHPANKGSLQMSRQWACNERLLGGLSIIGPLGFLFDLSALHRNYTFQHKTLLREQAACCKRLKKCPVARKNNHQPVCGLGIVSFLRCFFAFAFALYILQMKVHHTTDVKTMGLK